MIIERLEELTKFGKVEELKNYLKQLDEADPDMERVIAGDTRYLLTGGARAWVREKSLNFALMECNAEAYPTAELLLNEGAQTKTDSRWQPLHFATQHPQGLELTGLLLDWGADINAINSNGETALYQAVVDAKLELVVELLKRGADPNITLSVAQMTGSGSVNSVRISVLEASVELFLRDREKGKIYDPEIITLLARSMKPVGEIKTRYGNQALKDVLLSEGLLDVLKGC